MIKIIVFTLLTSALVGCNGGGGGSSDTASTPAGGSGGNGGSSGGNGNPSYYGFSTSGTVNENITLPASNTFDISNEFYFKAVNNTNPQSLELGVYQPTCLLGASSKDYAMVLMTKGSSAETTISMRVTSSGINTVVDAFDQTNNFKTRYGTSTSVTGTCTNGKMTLTTGDIVFSNGNFAIYKKGTDLYVGMSSSITLNSIANTRADIKLAQMNGVNEYTNVSNGIDLVSTRSSSDTATTMTVSLGQYTKYYFTNNTLSIDGSNSIRLTKVGGFTELFGVQGLIGGRTVNMFVASPGGTVRTTNLGDSNGATLHYATMVGADAVYISIEQ